MIIRIVWEGIKMWGAGVKVSVNKVLKYWRSVYFIIGLLTILFELGRVTIVHSTSLASQQRIFQSVKEFFFLLEHHSTNFSCMHLNALRVSRKWEAWCWIMIHCFVLLGVEKGKNGLETCPKQSSDISGEFFFSLT